MPEIIDGETESFVVRIERFIRDGKKFATISLYDVTCPDGLLDFLKLKHSYCDTEEIIDKAYYQAMREVDSKISNAGLLEIAKCHIVNELHACPHCNSGDISPIDEDYSPNYIVRRIICNKCFTRWDETYVCCRVDMR